MYKREFPTDFKTRMERQLVGASVAFFEALSQNPPTSVRLNPAKQSNRLVDMPSVAWCQEGRYLDSRPEFVTDPLIFGGAYYVQEASSMFIAHIFRQFAAPKPLRVLDLCAAPGGKSTLLSSLLPADSLLVANELVGKRVGALTENITRWGATNTVVSHNNIKDFAPLKGFFDVILLDAPCSGEGMFRKDIKALQQWSENLVRSCAITQRQLIEQAFDLLAPNGLFIFSTCTFSEEEDEHNIAKLLSFSELTPLRVPLQTDWGVTEISLSANHQIGYGYKFYPHLTKGEGFFATAFLKTDGSPYKPKKVGKGASEILHNKYAGLVTEYIDRQDITYLLCGEKLIGISTVQAQTLRYLQTVLRLVHEGIEVGTLKNNKLLPAHALALSQAIRTDLPFLSLSQGDALRYLQRKDFDYPLTQNLSGWVLVQHENINLGWIKVLPNRVNNYYPIEWRIRKDIEME